MLQSQQPQRKSKKEEIRMNFSYHELNPEQRMVEELLRKRVQDFAEGLLSLTPECREQSLALTALEEVFNRGKDAIARHPEFYDFSTKPLQLEERRS